jgi:hypothetical protein
MWVLCESFLEMLHNGKRRGMTYILSFALSYSKRYSLSLSRRLVAKQIKQIGWTRVETDSTTHANKKSSSSSVFVSCYVRAI